MNSASHREFTRLARPVQDLRPRYEAAFADVLRTVWRRRWMIAAILALVLSAAVAALLVLPKTYVGEALVQLKFENEAGAATGSGASGGNTAVDAASLVEGEAEILRSRAVARRVVAAIGPETARPAEPSVLSTLVARVKGLLPQMPPAAPIPEGDRQVMALQQGLKVKNDGKSYLIRVAYADRSPERAARIANAFADAYLQSRVEVSVNAALRTSQWLEAQIRSARTELAAADAKVNAFRNERVITAGEGDLQTADRQLGDLLGQLSAVRLDRLNLEARLARLKEAAGLGRTPSVLDLAGSTDAQRLIEAEVAARQNAAKLATALGTRHPLYLRAEQTLEAARAQLFDAVASAIDITRMDVGSAIASTASLEQRVADAQRAAAERQGAAKTLKLLETEADGARASVERLEESHRQALALAELKPVAAQLVSPAEPLATPASPKPKLVLILAGGAGLGLALLAVFLVEMRDTGFRSAREVEADLGANCAGLVPAAGPGGGDGELRQQALRALAVSCGLTTRGGGLIVAVTSTAPGEGKTELVRGLAGVLAGMNRRVLTIENAGRRHAEGSGYACTRHRAAGQKEITTVARVARPLAGTALVRDYWSASDDEGVFDDSDSLHAWVEEHSGAFDLILVEAPAVLVDAKAVVLSRMANLTLLVTRWNATPRSAVAAACAQLQRSQTPDLAVVLSEVDVRRHRRFGLKDNLHFARRYLGPRSAHTN
ncbi:exopolysaccharide transport family protein [Aurantimonas sp. Leaf443]|uniref:GumC family protein n=1 Tax=Aurantimonas sp. Leaf443 TaxID=1736378 RepID=UPI0007000F3D|nr:exopolysaccharide transport family protein [Aurantimonas sp. Leaf443]KQT88371.1 hypothetical protein ASG48_02820 [Aurantimonas sp. Leaf443]